MICVRSSVTSRRTSETFLQIPVPISMTDWCISGLTRSFKRSFPSSKSSWTCERSSRVSGSMIWNSSSTPSVKAGGVREVIRVSTVIPETGLRFGLGDRARRSPHAGPAPGGGGGGRLGGGEKLLPVPARGLRAALLDPLDQPPRGVLQDPLEVVLPHRRGIGIRRRVQEVDGVGHAFA